MDTVLAVVPASSCPVMGSICFSLTPQSGCLKVTGGPSPQSSPDLLHPLCGTRGRVVVRASGGGQSPPPWPSGPAQPVLLLFRANSGQWHWGAPDGWSLGQEREGRSLEQPLVGPPVAGASSFLMRRSRDSPHPQPPEARRAPESDRGLGSAERGSGDPHELKAFMPRTRFPRCLPQNPLTSCPSQTPGPYRPLPGAESLGGRNLILEESRVFFAHYRAVWSVDNTCARASPAHPGGASGNNILLNVTRMCFGVASRASEFENHWLDLVQEKRRKEPVSAGALWGAEASGSSQPLALKARRRGAGRGGLSTQRTSAVASGHVGMKCRIRPGWGITRQPRRSAGLCK